MTARGTTFAVKSTLVVEECANCHVLFGITDDMQDRLRSNHKTFYCPAGHSQSYYSKSEEEKLRERLEAEQRRVIRLRNEADAERRSHAATKGQLTKTRKRVANGVCPVPGCKRSGFKNVKNHLHAKHPDYVDV